MKNFNRHRGNFAVCLKSLAEDNQKFATPAEAMDERMQQGDNADICTEGAWYNASFNEVDRRILATKGQFNPLINYASQAVEAMRSGEFYLDGVLINNKPASHVLSEIAEQDAKKPISKKRVIDLGKTKTHDISTDCFGDDKTIAFLAGSEKRAEKYGLFLKNSKYNIQQSKIYMQDIIGKNKSRGFWLDRLVGGDWSGFGCNNRGLDFDYGSMFGVYESGEATQKTSRRIIQPTLSELLKYSKQFVLQAAREEFEKGLRAKFGKD